MPVLKDIIYGHLPDTQEGEYKLDLFLPDNFDETENSIPITTSKHGISYKEKITENNCYQRCAEFNDCTFDNCSYADTKHRKCDGRRPFVLFVHGGGWRRGNKNSWKHFLFYDVNFLVALLQTVSGLYSNVGEVLSARGVPCAIMSYPLTEVGPPFLVFEMLLSFIQCWIVTLILTLPLAITEQSLAERISHHIGWQLAETDHDHGNETIKLFLLFVTFLTNILVLTALLFDRVMHRLKVSSTGIAVFLVTCCVLWHKSMIIQVDTILLKTSIVVVLFLGGQGIIMYQRLRRRRHSHTHQLQAVGLAVQWSRKFCQRAGLGHGLYLMGHSAGGHLVTSTALDDTYLRRAGCSVDDIKVVY